MTIESITSDRIKFAIPLAKKEGLFFCASTHYFGYFRSGRLIGFCGALYYRHKLKVKNLFVFPHFRRAGVCSEMLTFLMDLARLKQVKIVEADCTPLSLKLFLDRGARITKTNKTATTVQIQL